jgi:hypothetical protein
VELHELPLKVASSIIAVEDYTVEPSTQRLDADVSQVMQGFSNKLPEEELSISLAEISV